MAKCPGDAFDEWERKFEVEKSDQEESLPDRGRGEKILCFRLSSSQTHLLIPLQNIALPPAPTVNHTDDCNQMESKERAIDLRFCSR